MKKVVLGVIAFIFFAIIKLSAQELVLSGQVIDRDTHKGIKAATVTTSATNGTLTDSVGFFKISVEKYPVELKISHLSYGIQNFTINFQPKQKLVFRLEQSITNIPEIMVSGKKLQVLTHGADFSVSEFEFDRKNMWLIGMVFNRPKKTRLFVANLIGDTLGSIPVKLPVSLIKDIFGNVHLVTKDSIFQLFVAKKAIHLLYGEEKDVFYRVMGQYNATLGEGLVSFHSNPVLHESSVYYIDQQLKKPEEILLIKNTPKDFTWLPPELKQVGRVFGPRTLQLIVDQQKGYFRELVSESVFKLQDSLYVIDLNNDLLHVIGPDRETVHAVQISFHHQPKPTLNNLYQNYDTLLTDQLNNKVYIVYHKNNNWRFVPLNPQTGKTANELITPKYNAMNNIRFHGGALYFTYPEKLYPYYQRIYRMVIK